MLTESADEYERMYVFSFENMRSVKFKDVRVDWRESKIFMGKNKVAQVAFGRSPEEEYKTNLRNISNLMEGNVGVLFTSRPKKEVTKYFKKFSYKDFAKAGTVLDDEIVLEPGFLDFPVSMVEELRLLGMVAEADNGKVALRSRIVVAKSGEPITPEQAKILVKMDMRTVDFKLSLLAEWTDENFTELH
jgi:mRNA turnover protein 4